MLSFIQKAIATGGGVARNIRKVVADPAVEERSLPMADVDEPFASAIPAGRRSSNHHDGDPARHRLFLLATAFVTRGLGANEAYSTAVYYVYGPGRGQTWIRALTEANR